VQFDPERSGRQWLDPVRGERGQVVRTVEAVAERVQPFAELTFVEGRSVAGCDRRQHPRDTRATHAGTGPGRLLGQLRQRCTTSGIERGEGSDEQRTGRKAVGREPPRWFDDHVERERAEPSMEGEPTVDTSGNGDGADVVPEWHRVVARRAQTIRIGAGSGTP
jgi:hypothetical protein